MWLLESDPGCSSAAPRTASRAHLQRALAVASPHEAWHGVFCAPLRSTRRAVRDRSSLPTRPASPLVPASCPPSLSDLRRIKQRGVIASTQAMFANPDATVLENFAVLLGPARASHPDSFRIFDDAGVVQAFRSDWGVFEPLPVICCAETPAGGGPRRDASRSRPPCATSPDSGLTRASTNG